ncbi:diguanylate cyclase [Pseudomonas syringae]|uniref:diguanylate cyclase n=1 Tax=Pseudomonas syringae TaxID=317 RepID=UPI003F7A2604
MMSLLDELITLRGYRPKILVVDDQPLNIRLIHEVFKSDYDVIMATDGLQAIQKCETQNPDLVLLDVMMPGISGHEVCRKLKASNQTRDIPVIFLTAQDEESEEALGFDLGAVDFIVKPIRSSLIRARVKSHLTLKLQSDLFKSIAMTDGLTGIANRRQFDERLQRDWLQCVRSSEHLSVLIVDVDHFKLYNDHYGHQQGDLCLQQVARAIKAVMKRPYDLAARYGGEEFACLLPGTQIEGAVNVATQVLEKVRELNLEHARSDISQHITVSIGVATQLARVGESVSALVRAADEKLYASKRQGRDRFTAVELDSLCGNTE